MICLILPVLAIVKRVFFNLAAKVRGRGES
jgi:hypothetical protein